MFCYVSGKSASLDGMPEREQLRIIPTKIKILRRWIKIFGDDIDTTSFKRDISLLRKRRKELKKKEGE